MYGETSLVDESFLAGLGVYRLAVPVPFSEAGGPANACALLNEDGSWTLFDSGVGTREGIEALEAQATASGVDLNRVTRIVVSHGHVDHFGNAQALAERSGARVFVHPADAAKLSGDERITAMVRRHRDYFLGLGVPGGLLDEVDALLASRPPAARYVDRHRLEPLHHGEVWRFRHFEAKVLHTPGHTPGLVCLHDEAHRVLFADDHLLARVSPNPVLDLSQGEGDTKFLALVRYVESARAVYTLELDCVVPGHGEPFAGHRALLDGLFEFYARRQEKLLAAVRATPATAYGLLVVLFPRRDAMRLLLMLSEVVANVEVLEAQGLVRRVLVGGVWTYQVSAC